jgi:hypothetical protein
MSLQKLANSLCFKEGTTSRRQRCIGLVLHFQFNVIYLIRCVHVVVLDLFVVRIFILNKVARIYCKCFCCNLNPLCSSVVKNLRIAYDSVH